MSGVAGSNRFIVSIATAISKVNHGRRYVRAVLNDHLAAAAVPRETVTYMIQPHYTGDPNNLPLPHPMQQ